ncbi:MAG TPA: gliding motility-associated C-terminal domain-containing protein, partial [Chryseosolibacter sp.]|nr:gliding motility-associated C-terminal domain-containing protein [Chryseosolibacter sp.]
SAEGTFANGIVTSEHPIKSQFVTLASASDNALPVVYNAVSSNNDGLNDFLMIGNIEFHPENKFILFNRWGDKIFEIDNYDNNERAFKGNSNIGGEKELVNGTYFYSLETKTGIKLNGFLVLKK